MMNSLKIFLLLAIVCLSWATITASTLDRTERHHRPHHDRNETERFNGSREVRHHHHRGNETGLFNRTRNVRQSADNTAASTTTGPFPQWGGHGGQGGDRPHFGGNGGQGGFDLPFGGPGGAGGFPFGGPDGFRPPFGGQGGPGEFGRPPPFSGGPSGQPSTTVSPPVVRRHHRPGHNGTQEG